MKTPLYTVRRVRKDDTFYGKSHGSISGNTTVCGFTLNGEHWWITNNRRTGVVDCPKCLKLL